MAENREIGLAELDTPSAAATSSKMMPNHESSDFELVGSVLSGNRESFGNLYDRYAVLVRAVIAGKLGGRAQVQDLTQETFLRAYQKLHRLRDPVQFRFWLVGIARQVAREHRRALRRDRHRYVDEQSIAAWTEPRDEPSVENAEEIGLVMRRLAELPDRERLAIHTFFLEECDAKRTAERLRLSRSGVYALLERAVARLAARVRGDGVTNKGE